MYFLLLQKATKPKGEQSTKMQGEMEIRMMCSSLFH